MTKQPWRMLLSAPRDYLLVFLLLGSFVAPGLVAAQNRQLGFGPGVYDAFDSGRVAGGFIEARWPQLFGWGGPWVGAEATTDQSAYLSAGILGDFSLGERWYFTPSFGAGYYHQGDGKDLGHDLEFRSTLELSYRFDGGQRVGLSVAHISNASLSDHNPGMEVVKLIYLLPLD